jgi:hypothetical protein
MMVRLLDRMDPDKRERLFNQAEQFIAETTTSPKDNESELLSRTMQ